MGIVLLALIVANSPLGPAYTEFWTHKVYLQIGDFNVFNHHGDAMTLMTFINDVLMTVFFFSAFLLLFLRDFQWQGLALAFAVPMLNVLTTGLLPKLLLILRPCRSRTMEVKNTLLNGFCPVKR